jgi:hypothetical protein
LIFVQLQDFMKRHAKSVGAVLRCSTAAVPAEPEAQQVGDLNRIAFVLIAFAVFVSAEFFVRRPRPLAGFVRAAGKWGWYLMGVVVLGALLAALFLYWAAVRYSNDPIAILSRPAVFVYAGIVLHAFLAIVFGWLAHKFYGALIGGKGPVSGYSLAAHAVPLLLVCFIGLFNTEIRGFVNQIARIETPYGIVDFNRRNAEVSWVLDKGNPQSTASDFQEGARMAEAAIDRAKRDLRNLAMFCDIAPQVVCLPPPDEVNPDGQAQAEDVRATHQFEIARMVRAMASTYDYAESLINLTTCLREYAQVFQNGVPIQDEISEIAANYSLLLDRGAASTSAEDAIAGRADGNKAMETGNVDLAAESSSRARSHKQMADVVIEEISGMIQAALAAGPNGEDAALTSHIDDMKNLAKERAADRAQELLSEETEGNIGLAMSRLIDYLGRFSDSHLNELGGSSKCHELETASTILDLRRRVVASGIVLPHRYLLQSALLTSAGYPEEGLGHLDKVWNRLRSHSSDGAGGVGPRDFVEFVFELRLLSEMGQLSGHLANQGKIKYEQRKLAYLKEAHKITRQWLDQQLDLHTNQPTEFMRQCASITYPGLAEPAGDDRQTDPEGRFVDLLRAQLVNHGVRSSPADRKAAWKSYVSNLIWYYFHLNFDRLSAAAWQDRDEIRDLDLIESQEWWEVAIDEPQLIENCFSTIAINYYSVRTFSLARIMMSYHFGLLHVQKGVKIQQAALLASSAGGRAFMSDITQQAKAESLICSGAVGLRKARELGAELKRFEDDNSIDVVSRLGPTIEPWMNQAASILTDIARQPIGCG